MKGWTKKFRLDDFRRLGGVQDQLCVSIYIPTHKSGLEVNEDQNLMLYKDELKRAEILLRENGSSDSEIKSILKEAKDLAKDKIFWKGQMHGFVVFITKGLTDHYLLPFNVEAFTYVGKGFYLTPLIPVVTETSDFYLLALARNGVSLFMGNHFDLEKVDISDFVPSNIQESTRYDVPEKESQFKSGMGAGALFFGNDSGEEMRKEDLKRYLHEVNNGVMKLIGSANVPLILAGVDNVVGEFRKMCKYTYLLDVCLTGNKDYTSEHELHKDAWNLIRPYFDQYTTSAVESYGDLSATKKTSSDIDEIVPASVYSRVDKLFLKENCHIWGYFDEKNNQVVLHKSYMKGDEDLANKAAIETLLHGGQVFMTSSSGMPEQTRDIAAVFRYEA